MGAVSPRDAVRRLAARAAAWPPLLRDLGAAGVMFWSVCLGELLVILLPLPAETVLALPGALVALLVFGAPSALFGLLGVTLVVTLVAAGRPFGLFGATPQEVLTLLTMTAGLATVCLAARVWARRLARRADLLLDACAGDALRRIAEADRRVAEAEAATGAARLRLDQAQAELHRARAEAAARRGRDAALEEARRSEGGI